MAKQRTMELKELNKRLNEQNDQLLKLKEQNDKHETQIVKQQSELELSRGECTRLRQVHMIGVRGGGGGVRRSGDRPAGPAAPARWRWMRPARRLGCRASSRSCALSSTC